MWSGSCITSFPTTAPFFTQLVASIRDEREEEGGVSGAEGSMFLQQQVWRGGDSGRGRLGADILPPGPDNTQQDNGWAISAAAEKMTVVIWRLEAAVWCSGRRGGTAISQHQRWICEAPLVNISVRAAAVRMSGKLCRL